MWFVTAQGNPPSSIYITLTDRLCGETYTSSAVSTPAAQGELIALEVNQSLQNWQNTVSLVEDKTTYVRAFIQSIGLNPVDVQARLRGFREGVELAGSPLSAVNPNGMVSARPRVAAWRGQWERSLNFRLPQEWLNGTLTLQLQGVGGNVRCRDMVGSFDDCAVEVTFIRVATPIVNFVNVEYDECTGGRVDETVAATLEEIAEMADRLISIYPIAGLDSSTSSIHFDCLDRPDLDELNDILELRRTLSCMTPISPLAGDTTNLCEAIHYGVIGDTATLGSVGLANSIPGTVASQYLESSFVRLNQNIQAHEIGHVMGRPHTTDEPMFGTVLAPNGVTYKLGPCGEVARLTAPDYENIFDIAGEYKATIDDLDVDNEFLVYGLDTYDVEVIDPELDYALMSYCGGATSPWVSLPAYESLIESINARFPGTEASTTPLRTVQLIRVTINFADGSAEMKPMLSISSQISAEQPAAGDYTLELRDADGILLEAISFQPSEYVAEDPGAIPETGFAIIPITANAAVNEIMVIHSEAVLASRSATANPPDVTVVYPNGGESLTEERVEVLWTASDPDGDPLTYVVMYSSNAGDTWETLGVDVADTSYEVGLDYLRGTDAGLFRIIASDGFNSASDDSDALFSVPNHPPRIIITAPGDTDFFEGIQQVFFEASASDREDGVLSGSSIEWASTADGYLGSGRVINIEATALSAGQHVIMATATDSAGLSESAIVTINISRGTLDVTAPSIDAGEDLVIECEGAETSVLLPEPVVTDDSDPNPIVTNDAPATFPFGCTTVTFTAVDASGNTASDSIEVCVVDTTSPVLNVPWDVTVECAGLGGQAVEIGAATAADACCDVTVGNDAPATFSLGDTVVTWTATDCEGNVATENQIIHVVDMTSPTLSV